MIKHARPQPTHVETVKDVIPFRLVVFENLDILEHLLVHLDFLVEPHRVLTQEIKDDPVRRLERDVLVSQGTTADRVRLVLALLVTRTKRKLVDEVQRSRTLSVRHDLGLEVLGVVLPDPVDVFLRWSQPTATAEHTRWMSTHDELSSLLELLPV
jgi:hypothetical protein